MMVDTATKEERMRVNKGMLIASAAASLIMAGALTARADQGKTGGGLGNCAGGHARKGEGSCATPENLVAGENRCKGKGGVERAGARRGPKGRHGGVRAEEL